jgi:hypothetical protein
MVSIAVAGTSEVKVCLEGLRGVVRQVGIASAGGVLDVPVSGVQAGVAV